MNILAGNKFSLLLKDGKVYSWGDNTRGALGIGVLNYERNYYGPTEIKFTPKIDSNESSHESTVYITSIYVNHHNVAAIDSNYNVYTWGPIFRSSSPAIIECLADKKVKKIYCTQVNTYVLTYDGKVYKLDGDIKSGIIMTRINFPNDVDITKLFPSSNDVIAIDANLKIYYWGIDNYNLLCNSISFYTAENTVVRANKLEIYNTKKIIWLRTKIIILCDKKLYSVDKYNPLAWAKGPFEIMRSEKFIQIKPNGDEGIEKVWGDDSMAFCKMTGGDLYAWGDNNYGELGIGNYKSQDIPVKLNIQLDIKSIKCCGKTIYAIATNGVIYTWGKNKLVSNDIILTPTIFNYFADYRVKSAKK